MNIKRVFLVTFSPTHTSRKTGEAIAEGLGYDNVVTIDLTLVEEAPSYTLSSGDLAIFALPVYGGAIAPLAMERIKNIQSSGALAIIVAVYGNRAFDNALTQLDGCLTQQGFRIIAAGASVGEHSYSVAAHPIAAGRPTTADLDVATSFGADVRKKIESGPTLDDVKAIDINNMPQLKQPIADMGVFFQEIVKAKKSGVPFPDGPSVDESLCSHCGICADNCPTKAINVGDECNTDLDRCIKCCACIKFCPQGARTLDTPYSALLSKYFNKEKETVVLL